MLEQSYRKRINIQGNRNEPEARDSSKYLVDGDILRGYPSCKYEIAQKLSNEA